MCVRLASHLSLPAGVSPAAVLFRSVTTAADRDVTTARRRREHVEQVAITVTADALHVSRGTAAPLTIPIRTLVAVQRVRPVALGPAPADGEAIDAPLPPLRGEVRVAVRDGTTHALPVAIGTDMALERLLQNLVYRAQGLV